MKIKIQVQYECEQTRESRMNELRDLATLFGLLPQRALYDVAKDIFVVQLPKDILHLNALQQAFAAFCLLKGHRYQLVYNSYPSVEF